MMHQTQTRLNLRQVLTTVLLCCSVLVGAAHAANCTVGVTTVAFGTYDPFSATPDDTTATLSASCTTTLAFETVSASITISQGSSGVYTTRSMLNTPEILNYNIFATTAYTLIVGDGTGGTVRYVWNPTVFPGPGVSGSATLYARAPAGQNVGPGNYTDTLQVTITY